MSVDELVGANVHELMWRQRIKQQRMYQAMGLSRGSLAKKLRGEVTWSASDIATAADVLHVDPGQLFTPPTVRPSIGDTRQYPQPPRLSVVRTEADDYAAAA